MSFTTRPAYVHYGDWNDSSRKHPAMRWMEDYTRAFDARTSWDVPYSDWHGDEWVMIKSDGSSSASGDEGWKEDQAVYAPFTTHRHEPYFFVCFETEYGWEMIGQAYVYGNLPGEAGEGEVKATDGSGKEWDVKLPGAFRFQYKKDDNAKHDGILMKRSELTSDSLPVVTVLMKRGIIRQ